jgi:H+/gluconate symporter-like permease
LKGLAMSIAIAFTYTAAGFVGIMFRPPQPGAGFAAGLVGVGVVLAGGVSLFLSLIGGVVGAVLHRRRSKRV